MDWKAILALAVLVAPLAHCEVQFRNAMSKEKVACIEVGGNIDWLNNCTKANE